MVVGSKSKWNYNFGIRVEQMSRELELKDKSGLIDSSYSYNFLKPFPTAIISYDLNSKSKIKFSYSKRVQRTTPFSRKRAFGDSRARRSKFAPRVYRQY